MTDPLSDDGFFLELERAAKALSMVTDRAASEELRRLVFALRAGDGPAKRRGIVMRMPHPAALRGACPLARGPLLR